MTITQIEFWAREIIDRVKAGRPSEDGRVEVKSDWISDHQDAARRIAGQANAARGEPILFIFGVDEKGRAVAGASGTNTADWYAQVGKHFDGFFPPMRDHIFQADGGTVVALQFDTDGAPFVVRIGTAGKITHEVPWREGTRIRSAGRAELLKILVPATRMPEVDLLSARLGLQMRANEGPGPLTTLPYVWRALVGVYVTPRVAAAITFPAHRCEFYVRADPTAAEVRLPCAFTGDGAGVNAVTGGARIEGPGTLSIRATLAVAQASYVLKTDAEYRIRLAIAEHDKAVELTGQIPWFEDKSPDSILWGDWGRSLIEAC